MARDLLKELPTLVGEGLISAEQAARISERYERKDSGSRALLLFAVLGSLFVGLGVVLLIAHNWNDLPRALRTALAFVPAIAGQSAVFYALSRKPQSAAWKEGSALFLSLGICACIALIGQLYHLGGDLEKYLLVCCFLMLPLLYIPGSIAVALLQLALTTWYAYIVYFENWSGGNKPWLATLLIVATVPAYLQRARDLGRSIGFLWFGLFLALSIGLVWPLFHQGMSMAHLLSMAGVAAAFTLIPWLHRGRDLRTHPWVVVGGVAMIALFFFFSYSDAWEWMDGDGSFGEGGGRMSALLGLLVGIMAVALSLMVRKPFEKWPYPEGFIALLVCYGLSLISPALAKLAVNLSLLAMGALTIKAGIAADSLRRMNLGMAILGLLVILRFFDSDFSFVLRGIAFILVGAGFLAINLWTMRQRKQRAHEQ